MYKEQIDNIEKLRKNQNIRGFTPIKMLYWLQSVYQIKKNINSGDYIYWMKKDKYEKIQLTLTLEQECDLNKEYNVFKRAKKIKEILDV